MKAELALVKGESTKESLTTEDVERCNLMVNNFIKTDDVSQTLVLPDRLMINQCFYHFRNLFKQVEKKRGGAGGGNTFAAIEASPAKSASGAATGGGGGADPAELAQKDTEVQRLNMLVKQRDNEIGILLNYLNK